MSNPRPALPPITAQDFQNILGRPDEELNIFLTRVYDETIAPYKAMLAGASRHFSTPKEAEVLDTMTKMYQVDINLSLSEHKPSKERINYTGIHGDMPMEGGRSVAMVQGQKMTLPKDTCLGCSASKAVAPGYSCDDMSDPVQVRSSQLNRAFVGLHEIAHSLLPLKVIATEFGKEKKEDINPFVVLEMMADTRGNERQADAFAAALLIRYLGAEGAHFVRQLAAGLRYMENGLGTDHDTTLALAKIMERYKQDPAIFTQGSLAGLMEMNVADAKEMATTSKISGIFESLSAFSSAGYKTPDAAYENAQQRLQLREQMQPAQQLMYDKYYRPADEMMMNMAGLTENLTRLNRHNPLDPAAPLGPQTEAIVAACKVKPSSSAP